MVLSFLPFFLLVLSVSQIGYLSLLSVLPAWQLGTFEIIGLHLSSFILTWILLRGNRSSFAVSPSPQQWFVLLPYLVILLIRFPLIYPTYDDLAAHFMWGDYANRLWQSTQFVPMNWLHYFYLPLDMNYTPFLYLFGVRITIWLFYALTSVWFFSLYIRFAREAKNNVQRFLLSALFVMLPFIPHLLGVSGTLMVDYGSLVFCIEALYLFINSGRDKTFAVIMMLTAILMKQSNSVFIAPLLLYYTYLSRKHIRWTPVILYGAIASLFFVRLHMETGNPISGLFNGIFDSPLFPAGNFSQPLFGPRGWFELVLWPIIGQFGERYAEGIVSTVAKIFFAPIPIIGYVVSLWLMIRQRSLKYGLLAVTYLLWSHLVGYARYYIALNLMALIVMIFDLPKMKIAESFVARYKPILLALIFVGSMSSFKTDFSWRPHPSLATPAANAYYLREYREGLGYVGRDTLPALAREYATLFSDYEAVITVYRGPVTFFGYMGYLNGLPVHDGVTNYQYDQIMASAKVSDTIKSSLAKSVSYSKVLVLAEKPFDENVPALKIYDMLTCTLIGPGTKDPYLQRETYFTQTVMYSCERP